MITINYYDTKNSTRSKDFDLKDEKVTSSGSCNDNTTSDHIKLEWMPKNGTYLWDIVLTFGKVPNAMLNTESNMYQAKQIDFNYLIEKRLFPDANATGKVNTTTKGSFFKAKVGQYYTCATSEKLNLSGKSGVSSGAILNIRDTKVEAYFSGTTEGQFVGSPEQCDADSKTSSLVPILVGVALAIMILIALVVFMIGSRRRAAAYESL